MSESVITLGSSDSPLFAIQHWPEPSNAGESASNVAVLVLVGGPQYRVGSHRQFVELARTLSDAGYPTLRFDFQGMGDSPGDARHYLQNQPDIDLAIAHLLSLDSVENVVLWGLCDAASVALLQARNDPRVTGLVLLNPWVRTPHLAAQSLVKNYYRGKFFSLAYWKRFFSGEVNIVKAIRSFMGNLIAAQSNASKKPDNTSRQGSSGSSEIMVTEANYVELMLEGLRKFQGPTLLILSGNDMTADEFTTLCSDSAEWQSALNKPTLKKVSLKDANHTFSSMRWKRQVERETEQWLNTHF